MYIRSTNDKPVEGVRIGCSQASFIVQMVSVLSYVLYTQIISINVMLNLLALNGVEASNDQAQHVNIVNSLV